MNAQFLVGFIEGLLLYKNNFNFRVETPQGEVYDLAANWSETGYEGEELPTFIFELKEL